VEGDLRDQKKTFENILFQEKGELKGERVNRRKINLQEEVLGGEDRLGKGRGARGVSKKNEGTIDRTLKKSSKPSVAGT